VLSLSIQSNVRSALTLKSEPENARNTDEDRTYLITIEDIASGRSN
jgi:hypothetical protein